MGDGDRLRAQRELKWADGELRAQPRKRSGLAHIPNANGRLAFAKPKSQEIEGLALIADGEWMK